MDSNDFLKRIRQSGAMWQRIFGLTDWNIEVRIDTDNNPDEDASVDFIPERSFATIYVSEDIDEDNIDYLIVHEMLHIVHCQRKQILRGIIEALDTPVNIKAALLGMVNTIEEQNVDAIAKIIIKPYRQGGGLPTCSPKKSSSPKSKARRRVSPVLSPSP